MIETFWEQLELEILGSGLELTRRRLIGLKNRLMVKMQPSMNLLYFKGYVKETGLPVIIMPPEFWLNNKYKITNCYSIVTLVLIYYGRLILHLEPPGASQCWELPSC